MFAYVSILALLAGVNAQDPAAAPAGSAPADPAAAAPAALDTGTFSVNPNLPQTAAVGPQGYIVPSLSAITSGMPGSETVAMYTTVDGGATAPITNAPPMPTFVAGQEQAAKYPPMDALPPVDSPEVKQWVSEINWQMVPNYTQSTGICDPNGPEANDGRCWWTCGGCVRDTDITTCPDHLTWGLSFDDGPSPYTPLLLDYLNQEKLTSTFFVVGSRVISRPEMVRAEYAAGHQLSIHTWSHQTLTTLTNEQIVAELGWTKKAIKDVIGVTPNTFRPPYGDIDDRVRAIAAQMGLTPIMWSRIDKTTFDTDDWNIPGGKANGPSSFSRFQKILEDYAEKISTGFIVLEHDLYVSTVDLAVGYFLPLAVESKKFALKSIIDCLHLPNSEAYIETSSNTTATTKPYEPSGTNAVFQPTIGTATGEAPPTVTAGGQGGASGSAANPSGSGAANQNSGAGKPLAPLAVAFGAVVAAIALA